ncbi:LytTR family two component transcriptional regulator [Ruminococcaceae bacterium R-25]|nr:LytTR family two component transcriptional regulator [Ruminococcaceae bacterium R-25]SUQ11619.1 two component transcriptional regulator, LytTR family [Oscillospiraceae bacterium]
MRIAICDDEELYRVELKTILDKLLINVDYNIDTFDDGNRLIESFKAQPYDILFLDIEMPAVDGITLAKSLRAISEKVFIVFLTSHVEYAIEGYEVNALRYLTKPVDIEKLKEVIRYVQEKQGACRQLIIKEDGEELLININDVIYLESMNQNVRIVTTQGEHVIRYNIGDFEEQLKNDGFFRSHRGYLISLAKVKKLSKNDVIMEGDVILPVSRSNVKALKDALYTYVEGLAF